MYLSLVVINYLYDYRLALEKQEWEIEAAGGANKNRMLRVKLPETEPEPFKMVLNYIYTDRIDPTEKGFH